MKKTITFFKSLLLAVILLVGSGSAWGATVTYTISAKNTLTTTGTAVSGSSATMVETYKTSKQMTSGNSQTLTLSGYSGYKITSITLSMRSNKSDGSGNFIYKINGGEDNTIISTATFNNSSWYGSYSESYVNVIKSVDITCGSTSTVLKIAATVNSLYCQSYTLTYEAISSCTTPTYSFASSSVNKLSTDAAFTNAFTSNNTSAKVWSSTNEAVATVDSNGEVTIVGAGSTNIRVNQAADATYCAVVDASYALTVTAPGVAEPTNQPTELSATTNSTSQITVTWTDATGAQLPEHYLVKASTGTITAPVDGTAEADAALVQNIAQGKQTAVFRGLDASTTYNFSIWPYTNSGAAIDYKTDGIVATASATTETPLGIPVATAATDVTPTGFTANWGAAAAATGYDISVYTKSDTSAPELVTNGGFENTLSTDDWGNDATTTNFIVNTTGGHNAAKYLSRTGTSTLKLEQTITTEVGKQYVFSFWYKGYTQSGNGIKNYTIQGNTGSTYIEGGTPVALPSATEWTQYTKTFTATQTSVKISIRSYVAASFDDVSLKAVDNVTTTTDIPGSPFTVTETSKAVSGLNPGTEYFYTVVAKNATGSSVASNEISVTTPNITFTGTGEWTETARWNTGVVPGNTAQVVVDGAATINSDVEVAGLTINAGKSLTVNAAKKLTISGTATNNGTITIQSDVNGTGTIVGNVSGTATVNQYLPGYRTWYLSSPVASATPSGMDRIKYYDETKAEASESWVATTTMTKGKGYLVVPLSGNNILFSGTLNNGNVNIDVTRSVANGSKPGFNLVGNPYPSYLEWSKVNDANSSLMPSSTMWYRTKKQNQSGELVYQFWTVNGDGVGSPNGASQYIPPMQAFWVRAKSSGQLQLTNDMRSHAPATDYLLKAPAVNSRTLIRLELSNGTNTDEAVLYLSENANNALDALDAPKMSIEDASIAEIFTRAGNEKLVINALQSLPKDTEIALGFEAGSATTFTLRVNELSNLPSDVKLILKDNVTKAETDMTDGTAVYSFSNIATSGDRFSIIFRTKGAVTGIDQPTFSGLSAYSNANNQLTVLYDGAIDAHTVVSVYNAVGQRLVTQSLKGVSTVIDGEFAPGVYVVKVNNLSRKLTIKN